MSAAVLEFDEPTHVYRLNGQRVPSVTQVLEPYSGREFVDPAVWNAAAAFGTNVHIACDLYNKDQLDLAQLDEPLVPYVRAWSSFLEDTGAVVVKSEHRVFSRLHRAAGTLDDLVVWDRDDVLIDIKSTASVPKTVGPQTAAYAEFHREMTGQRLKRRYCCHLRPDGTYKLHELKKPSDLSIFLACLAVWRWHWADKCA